MIHLAKGLGANSLKINNIASSKRSDKIKKGGMLLTIPEIININNKIANGTIEKNGLVVIFDIPPAFKTIKEIQKEKFSTCRILNLLGVLHNGHAGLCGISASMPELDFGNILKVGLKEIWEESEVLNYLRKNFPDNIEGICSKCIFKKGYCRGKCIANTYYEKRDLLAGFTFCQEAYEQGLFPETRIV
jgi:radical SAM protein with 4Fe4S-binding SPASM domain